MLFTVFFLFYSYSLAQIHLFFNEKNMIRHLEVFLVNDIQYLNVKPYVSIQNSNDIYDCMIYASYAIANLLYTSDTMEMRVDSFAFIQHCMSLFVSSSQLFISTPSKKVEQLISCLFSLLSNVCSKMEEKRVLYELMSRTTLFQNLHAIPSKGIRRFFLQLIYSFSCLPTVSERMFNSLLFDQLVRLFYASMNQCDIDALQLIMSILFNFGPLYLKNSKKELCILTNIKYVFSISHQSESLLMKSLSFLHQLYTETFSSTFLSLDFSDSFFTLIHWYSTNTDIVLSCLFFLKRYYASINSPLTSTQLNALNSLLSIYSSKNDIVMLVLSFLTSSHSRLPSSAPVLSLQTIHSYFYLLTQFSTAPKVCESVFVLLRYYLNNSMPLSSTS